MPDELSSEKVADPATDYSIEIRPSRHRVRVEFNGAWVANSVRALEVRETRLAPAYYFPPEDVRMDLLEHTAYQTHCPFKGNATHWTVSVGDEVSENAVWCYEDSDADGASLRGMLSFYPDRVSAIYEGDDEVPFASEEAESMHANPIAGWLLRDAWKAESHDALVQEFGNCLRNHGYPISRMTVIIPTLHPQIFATVLVWRDDAEEVKVIFEPHDILHQPKFADSPFAPIIRGAGGVRRRLEGDDVKLDFPVIRELHEEGATDYVAMPFHFADGQINVLSMTSFVAGGFTTAHLGHLYEVLPTLGRLLEVHAQRRVAVGLLKTYLGQYTGERVLNGLVKHGDGEHIHAVIWFSDFRDSTALSEQMDRETYLLHLNRFFNCVAGAVLDQGGEVLRFIGDAMLAIFPIVGTATENSDGASRAREACTLAAQAAWVANDRITRTNNNHPDMPPLKYGVGLHLGDVTYGNIGVSERLEFTVIGSAANEAARVESMTKELQETVLISSEFASHYSGEVVSKGRHRLKGLEGERELFALRNA